MGGQVWQSNFNLKNLMKIDEVVVDLSAHPEIPGIARKAQYDGHLHSHPRKVIEVHCRVTHHLASTGAPVAAIADRPITLIASDRNWIDRTTFANVYPTTVPRLNAEDQIEGYDTILPDNAVNEYDYWLGFFENPIPDFFMFLTQLIGLRASEGRFD